MAAVESLPRLWDLTRFNQVELWGTASWFFVSVTPPYEGGSMTFKSMALETAIAKAWRHHCGKAKK
jgi:hypothetical protein